MTYPQLPVAVAALLMLAQPAEPHCYRVWKYPEPQRCGVALARPVARQPKVRITVAIPQALDIPMTLAPPPPPISSGTPWWGELKWEPAPEAADELRARLILETLAQ